MTVALAAILAGAWPTAGVSTNTGSVSQPSPSGRADRVDFNGDGFDDLAVGLPSEQLGGSEAAGAVNVLYGSASGLVGRNQLLFQGSPGVAGTAETGDQFGNALARGTFPDDFNHDGLADLAVGVVGEDVGAIADAGAVNVL